ncbi:MAG TPA: hypothetical protein VGT06_13250 [Candidatus Methylomirabilis sp.]|jgi:hypothetical protein|nr:hypothetical protein [Candidatus Methylomirabilis sp.]
MEFTPAYVTYEELHAERIRQVLQGGSVPCRLRSMRVAGYAGLSLGPLGEIQVLVPPPYVAKAKRLIAQAMADGVLWPCGAPVEGE